MAKPRVKLKMKGVRAVLTSSGARSRVASVAKAMANDAGEGFEYSVNAKRAYTRAAVRTKDQTGRERQSREHVLQKVWGKRR